MERLSMTQALDEYERIAAVLESGGLIIVPTDTIYGLCCHAYSEPGLAAIRSLKERWGKPMSIIAPSKEWIEEHFVLGTNRVWLDELPGRYTLVLTPREPFSEQLSVSGTVGVRIPDHPIARLVERLGFPIAASSVNRAGFEPLVSIDQLGDSAYERFGQVAFAIDDGVKEGPPSSVVDVTGERPVYVRM
ncbi:MAG: L-threonylcarbamoyladenylate synthase [Candidatus Woesearchaeota archaeon]